MNAAGASVRGARELGRETVAAASLFVDRRESALNESDDYLRRGRGAGHRAGAHRGRARRAARRRPPRTAARRRADAVQVAWASPSRIWPRQSCAWPARASAGVGVEVDVLIPLAEIEAARERIADVAIRTPLVRLQAPESPAEIWLKLECLQPIGSFKIRGAANAIRSAPPGAIAGGVLTTSAGNMAQGVAWMAREEGVPATIIAPEHAPQTKLDAIERLGGRVIKVPFERWWQAMEEGAYPGVEGYFVHPVMDEAVMAGNGTIGLELVEELDEIDTVLVPWGGGGLTTGIASALAALSPRDAGASPASPRRALRSSPRSPPASRSQVDYTPSFVDGAGSKALLPPMWERARPLLAGAFAPTLDETAAAVRLARRAGPRDRRGGGSARGRGGDSRDAPATDGSCASCRAATSTPSGLPRSSRAARRPDGSAATSHDAHDLPRPRCAASSSPPRGTPPARARARRARWRRRSGGSRACSSTRSRPSSAAIASRSRPASAPTGRGTVGRLLAQGRVFEYWAHEACLLPVEEWPLFVSQMRQGGRRWYGDVGETHPHLADEILAEIRARGPLGSRHFEGTSEGGMWNWKPAKAMLDRLWNHGDLVIAGRQGFQRLYDLPERVIPQEVLEAPVPASPSACARSSLKAVTARGALTEAGVVEHWRLQRAVSRGSGPSSTRSSPTASSSALAVEDGGAGRPRPRRRRPRAAAPRRRRCCCRRSTTCSGTGRSPAACSASTT